MTDKAVQHNIDLDAVFWDQIIRAAGESDWIPPEYYTNDWVNDVCHFLRTGEGINPS